MSRSPSFPGTSLESLEHLLVIRIYLIRRRFQVKYLAHVFFSEFEIRDVYGAHIGLQNFACKRNGNCITICDIISF